MLFACRCDRDAMVFQHRAVRSNREGSRGCGSVGRASPCQGEGRGFESRHPLGRLAQRERASLTRKRSLVRSQYRPPEPMVEVSPEPSAPGSCRSPGKAASRRVACVTVRPRCRRRGADYRAESRWIEGVGRRRSGTVPCLDRDVPGAVGNGASRRALPSGEELAPAARNGWL